MNNKPDRFILYRSVEGLKKIAQGKTLGKGDNSF
jgi:hypothetical protein